MKGLDMKTNLQKLRKRAGFKSAREFAEKHAFNVNTYTAYEQGRPMPLEVLIELTGIFRCTVDELLALKDVEDLDGIDARFSRLDEVGKTAVLEQLWLQEQRIAGKIPSYVYGLVEM